MTLEVAVESVDGVDDGRTVSSLDVDGEEVAVEPRKPPALDAGGVDGVDGDRVVEVDVVDDVGDGDRGVEVMVMGILGIPESLALDETELAVQIEALRKKPKHHWTLLQVLMMVRRHAVPRRRG